MCVCSDPAVVPVESEEEKAEHSDPEKDEDMGITFVARKVETPKQRPKSGRDVSAVCCCPTVQVSCSVTEAVPLTPRR